MARLGQGGDLRGINPEDASAGKWRALPDGDYRFVIVDSDYKQTSKGNGMVLHLFLQCVEPAYRNTKWREFLTLEHTNPETVRIARAKLKQLAVAIGHPNPDMVKASEELQNKPFIAHVIAELSGDPKYGDAEGLQNRVSEFKSVKGAAPSNGGALDEEPPPSDDDYVPPTDADVTW